MTDSSSDVFIVDCGDIKGDFHVPLFTSGGRSRCIKYADTWISPVEFEEISGKGASHNWKRTIRRDGSTLGKLIETGVLKCRNRLSYELISSSSGASQKQKEEMLQKVEEACRSATRITAPAATEMVKPKNSRAKVQPEKSLAPVGNLSLNTRLLSLSKPNDEMPADSDSGISLEDNNYTKALKITIPSTSSKSEEDKPQVPHLNLIMPDYPTLIQEALYCLSESTAEAGGCSPLNILLYAIDKYKPKENVEDVLRKVKGGLRFLHRMGVIQKTGGEEEDEAADEFVFKMEEEPQPEKTEKKKEMTSNPQKQTLAKLTGNKDSGKQVARKSDEKKKKKKKKKDEQSGSEKKVRITNNKPKKLSKALAAICGGKRILLYPEVVRHVWLYVKDCKLQDPLNKNTIISDEKLRSVTKRKRFPQEKLLTYVAKHMKNVVKK